MPDFKKIYTIRVNDKGVQAKNWADGYRGKKFEAEIKASESIDRSDNFVCKFYISPIHSITLISATVISERLEDIGYVCSTKPIE